MERGILRLYYSEEVSTLDAEVAAGNYSGTSWSVFDTGQLEQFAKAISEYPLPGSDRCCLKQSLGETGVHITARPLNSRGHLGVQGRLWSDRQGLPMKVEIELLVTYAALERFSRDLLSLTKGETDVAVLEEEAVL